MINDSSEKELVHIMISESNVVLCRTMAKEYPNKKWLFRPSESYVEYLYKEDISDEENLVYDAVREALYLLGLDRENFGKKEWNPLGDLIRPGDNVLIKPNMVMDFNGSGEGTDCLYTQPSVVAAIVDYVIVALKGVGKIVIGDAPMQECKFEKLIEESGYKDLVEYYQRKGTDITLVDFRELKTDLRMGARHQLINENAKGTIIDLKDESEFSVYDSRHLEHLRITNYTPERLRQHHMPGKHEYYVSDYVLNANVIINMPKPKTHRKAGVTIALKNLVGINVRKEFLPHHTIGSTTEQGDEYNRKSLLRKISSRCYDCKNYHESKEQYIRSRIYGGIGYGLKGLTHYIYKDEMEGNWYGNHTISKTIMDLNKILLYADKNGVMHNEAQRKVLNVADMIISGEKEGPVSPSPKYVGYIVVGCNSVNFDKVVGTMMGADISALPVLQNAEQMHGKLEIKAKGKPVIISNNSILNGKRLDDLKKEEKWNFTSTRGWKKIFE